MTKGIVVNNSWYNLENVKKVEVNAISSSQKTRNYERVYIYSSDICIEYFNNERSIIYFDEYQNEKELLSRMTKIFTNIINII